MPAVENGHGFQGVLLQDEDRKFVQCHCDGKWMRKITTGYLKKYELDTKMYKEKYGINPDTGLVSDETSLRLTKACLKNKSSISQKTLKAGGNRGKKIGRNHTMEFFNKYGTCPLQLKERLYDFIRRNREFPSQHNRGRKIYKALVSRYGSWGYALQEHGLPFFKRKGTNYLYVFADGTKYKYNINQSYDREELFYLLMKKCQVLRIDPKKA